MKTPLKTPGVLRIDSGKVSNEAIERLQFYTTKGTTLRHPLSFLVAIRKPLSTHEAFELMHKIDGTTKGRPDYLTNGHS